MKVIYTIIIAFLLIGCVQKEHQKTITFNLDMRGLENPTNVGVRGNFTIKPWRETVFLTDDDNDGIYTISLSRETAGYGIEFKFVNKENIYELVGKDNREIVFEYKPETIVYSTKFNEEVFTIKR